MQAQKYILEANVHHKILSVLQVEYRKSKDKIDSSLFQLDSNSKYTNTF